MANADVHGFALTMVLSAVRLLSPAIPVEVNTEPKEVKQFSQYRGQILARAEIQIQPNVMKIVASGADCLRSNPNANHFLCVNLGELLKSLYFHSLICKMVIRTDRSSSGPH